MEAQSLLRLVQVEHRTLLAERAACSGPEQQSPPTEARREAARLAPMVLRIHSLALQSSTAQPGELAADKREAPALVKEPTTTAAVAAGSVGSRIAEAEAEAEAFAISASATHRQQLEAAVLALS